MNEEVVKVRAVGWEWECPFCGSLHSMSSAEYSDGFPLDCDNCGNEFMSEVYYW